MVCMTSILCVCNMMQIVTYNPDTVMVALMTVTFTFDKGGTLKHVMDVAPLRLRQFNYAVSTWDSAYGIQVS